MQNLLSGIFQCEIVLLFLHGCDKTTFSFSNKLILLLLLMVPQRSQRDLSLQTAFIHQTLNEPRLISREQSCCTSHLPLSSTQLYL